MSESTQTEDIPVATVLVVEDEALVRWPIVEYLRECGFEVLEAEDALEAIALVNKRDRVDVVFSDVRMPGGMDGIGLAAWLHQNRPDVPVLLTSGYNSMRTLGPELGDSVKLIEKPYSQAQVVSRIEALLHHHP